MIQVYTGNGKGKTTAALGLATRAAGAGLKVFIGQFLKKGCYSELSSLGKIKNIKVEQFGTSQFVKKNPSKKDIEAARKGLERIKRILSEDAYDIIILDEINIALKLRLLSIKSMMDIIENAPRDVELVLTGRYAPTEILKVADLASEIKELKHYYKKGLKARKGIEF